MPLKSLNRSLAFLTRVSDILSSSLDYQTTLNSIAKIMVPEIADWCAVDMLNEEGVLVSVAVAHKDPEKMKWAEKFRKEYPVDLSAKGGVGDIFRTGKSAFYPVITDKMLVATAKDKRHLNLIRKIGMTSVIIVPIKTQDRVVGVISLISAESGRPYTEVALELAEQLASRAALAIENSLLYRAVEQERERLNRLLGNVPGVVWEAWGHPNQSSQRVNFVSAHVERMLGYTVADWLATPNFWLSIVHPADKEMAAQESAKIFQSGTGGVSRFRWLPKKGGPIWVEAHSFVIKDSKGIPIGMRGVTMDISERMELERRKDEFISTASHELKTPITTIKGYTQILYNYFEPDEKASYYLKKMDAQVNRLTTLVNDLLDVSKIQAGKLEFDIEAFDINELVEDIVEDLAQTTERHQIVVDSKGDGTVRADKYRISQVLINFLSNAIKYSPQADKIFVQTQSTAETVSVSVQDFGIGITKSNLSKIFERFFQIGSHIRPSFSGLGLGLYISTEIVKRHGGEIKVESEKGKGSTFIFILPKNLK